MVNLIDALMCLCGVFAFLALTVVIPIALAKRHERRAVELNKRTASLRREKDALWLQWHLTHDQEEEELCMRRIYELNAEIAEMENG